ncbi:TerD family protein [Streptomyces sp. NPDC047725]|uniref:TerD family protein n=1 Tax=Streptomyces sp. NPDC047725 TaxID=3365487 RepID=UPI00370FFF27
MTHITKGANAPVPTAPLRVAVGRNRVPGAPSVEAAALLLDAAGSVRGDADIVFHGQVSHPSGAVRHVGTGEGGGQLAEWLELDLPRIEQTVQRVLIAGSCDDGVFGQVPGLFAQVVAPGGGVVAHYDVTDASSETAFVLGEFYRRDGAWRFRAVGQGYDSGLAGLATDFGVVVAEPAAAAPGAPAVAPGAGHPAPGTPPVMPGAGPAVMPGAGPMVPGAAAPVSGPVPLTGVGKTGAVPAGGTASAPSAPAVAEPALPGTAVPAFAPPASTPAPVPAAPAPGPAGTVPTVPAPSPAAVPAVAAPTAAGAVPPVTVPSPAAEPDVTVPADADAPSWGGEPFEFEPLTFTGKNGKTIVVDLPFPPDSGPVILEAKVQEFHFLHVQIPGREDDVFCTDLPDYYGRALLVPPRKGGPVKLKVRHSGKWELTVLPLSAARRLGAGTIEGSGRDVFLHTGPASELKVRATDRHNGWFQLNYHAGDTLDELRRPAEELVHAWNGRRVKETVRIPEGPLLLVIDKSRHQWELTVEPEKNRAASKRRAAGVYEGKGDKKITLVSPRPGRPSLVRYEFQDAGHGYGVEARSVDEFGDETDWLNTYAHGVRGTGLTFGSGAAARDVRIKYSGQWSLQLLPEEQAPLITGPVEGKGTTVLRYQGPPTLMTVRRTSRKKEGRLTVHAWNHPYGKSAIIADVSDRHRPALGPVWVDPGGTCFVLVGCPESTKWRLEPTAFTEAPLLGARTQGTAYGVVRHTGPDTEVSFVSTGGIQHLYQLDENLFPRRKVTATSGPLHISEGILHVRAIGDWVIEKRT